MGCCPTVRTAQSEPLSGGLRAITLLLSVVSNLLSSSTWLQGTAGAAMLALLVLKAASPLYLNAQLPPYVESTKQRIVHYVLRNPGRTGGEIASALGLDRSRVNSFLYSEGRRRFGLQDNNWRWSATGVVSSNRRTSRRSTVYVPPAPSSGRSRERQLPITSICGSLSRLSITDATLKIRGMNEQQINLAFAEDDYGLLDDRLQAELAMRRSELLNARPAEAVPSSPFSNPLVLIGLGLMVVIFLGNVMSNSSSDRLPQRSVPGSVR